MMRTTSTILMAGVAAVSVFQLSAAQTPSPSPANADALLASAEAKAAMSKENVLVIYHASWCGWCHRLDKFLADPKILPIMTRNYQIIHIDVLENDKKALENPGGQALMESMGGKDAGLPIFVILSPKADVLSTSVRPGTGATGERNIGYPAKADEIDYFMGMLHATGKHLSGADEVLVRQYLETDAKKSH
jgi:hypothetical protein